MSILGWIILGLIAGWLAGVLVKGSGYGVVGDIVLGILGALVGGAITSTLMGVDITGFNLTSKCPFRWRDFITITMTFAVKSRSILPRRFRWSSATDRRGNLTERS